MNNLFLAGDIGGTNARFALVASNGGTPALLAARTYPTHDGGVTACAKRFVTEMAAEGKAQTAAWRRGVFGIAGPVVDGSCHMPNAGWSVTEKELLETLGFPVRLVNDMVVNAAGIAHLGDDALHTVLEGQARPGHRVLLAPGTGLGKAILPWDGARHGVVAGEGGHIDFAPRNPEEDALVVFLRARFGRVSTERVACGQAIPNLYTFLKETGRAQEPAWLRDALAAAHAAGQDMAPIVFKAAFEKNEPIALEVFRLFATILGSEAGNLCLTAIPEGGCYLGGGILPRIAAWISSSGHFQKAFLDKAPHRAVLERIPVKIITHPETALVGAAGLAVG